MTQNRDLDPVTVYLDPELIARFEERAKAEERTLSAELRRILVAYDLDARGLGPNTGVRPRRR